MHGKFVISLDFELMWGRIDKKDQSGYHNNIRGVHGAIPKMLKTFGTHQVKATFATVGFLFFETRDELKATLPSVTPGYLNPLLSPYGAYLQQVGENASLDPFHFAPELIRKIAKHPQHEIASHTFSHYYCLEEGQTVTEFKADLQQALRIAREKYQLELTSLVFPRNQFNNHYLEVCKELGIRAIRGNESSWIYKAKNRKDESLLLRTFRFVDAYVNLTGHHCYSDEYMKSSSPVNIPSSRFLRPYSPKLRSLEKMRLRRIKSSMTYAAQNGLTYHLWWHPHNFGIHQDQNIQFLNNILDHYKELNEKFNFQSYTMAELTSLLTAAENEKETPSKI